MAVSIVIRAHNEAQWLPQCLQAIRHQSFVGEVEVVIVDNDSTDDTRPVAISFGCRYVSISREEFSFGGALNLGVQQTSHELVGILSAHCIPLNDLWLLRLATHFRDPEVAAVYGRQEPLRDSDDLDKRDLWITFGIERRVQHEDPFFHNANAMIRKSTWERVPFNDSLAGQEDRRWAKDVMRLGYSIVYEPKASVYHHHGIHQGRDVERAKRVVRIIQLIDSE